MKKVKYRLMRQDDNGNKLQVRDFDDPEEAQKAKEKFEKKAHKQIYWIEEIKKAP